MKGIVLFGLSFLCVGALPAFGCSCGIPVVGDSESSTRAHWADRKRDAADVVVLARVISVTSPSAGAQGLNDSAALEVRETFKGKAIGTIVVRGSLCQGFALSADEIRVFFLKSNGEIVGCSDYQFVMNQDDLVTALRKKRTQGAT